VIFGSAQVIGPLTILLRNIMNQKPLAAPSCRTLASAFSAVLGKGGGYFVYVLLCDDGSYYTGYSNNPTNRLIRHLKGQGARYTRMHKPNGIVYLQALRTRSAAMKRERQIKALTHAEKTRLIERRGSVGP
jgi:putative endonuclease